MSTVRYRAADAIRREQLETARFPEPEEDETVPTTCSRPASDMEESAQVESVLRKIRDPRKRLAFRLYMDGVPRNSTKAESVASALGVSAKTVETWIKETKEQLKGILKVDHDE